MKLRMVTNLGIADALRLDLRAEDAREGETVDCKKEAAEELLKRGWAVAVEEKADAPKPHAAAEPPRPHESEPHRGGRHER